MRFSKRQIKGNQGKILDWVIVIIGGLIIASLLILPLFNTGGPPPKRVVCMLNLKDLSLSLHLYADDNNGYFPNIGKKGIENLSVLIPKYEPTAEVFYCPADPHRPHHKNEDQIDWPKVSYFYIEGLNLKTPKDTIIMGDKSFENHDWKGRNVLFVDGHVDWEDAPYPSHIRNLERRIRNYKIAVIVVGIVCLFTGYFLREKRQKKLNP